MTVEFAPCMGGWCSVRNRCPHYRSDDINEPAERLCPPRQDGAILELPVRVDGDAQRSHNLAMVA